MCPVQFLLFNYTVKKNQVATIASRGTDVKELRFDGVKCALAVLGLLCSVLVQPPTQWAPGLYNELVIICSWS